MLQIVEDGRPETEAIPLAGADFQSAPFPIKYKEGRLTPDPLFPTDNQTLNF
jgi:hypothetical protein